MGNTVKRIGYLPRKRVLEIIDEISKNESISRSKVVGILVEEALDARGIANFGYSNISKSNLYKSDIYKEVQNENINLKDAEDEFVDDSGYTVSSHNTLDRSISSSDMGGLVKSSYSSTISISNCFKHTLYHSRKTVARFSYL